MESSCFFRRNIFDIVRWTFIMMRVSRWSRVSSIRIIFIVLSSERFFFDKSRICFPENNLKKKLDISDKFTAMIYYIIITNKIIHLFLSCNKNSISITLLSMILVRLHESGPRFLSKETNWTPCPLVLTGMRHCAKMKITSLIAYKKETHFSLGGYLWVNWLQIVRQGEQGGGVGGGHGIQGTIFLVQTKATLGGGGGQGGGGGAHATTTFGGQGMAQQGGQGVQGRR